MTMTNPSTPSTTFTLRSVLPPWLLVAIVAVSIAFAVFPQIDLAVSHAFATDHGAFPSGTHWLFDAFSGTITRTGRGVALALTIAMAISLLPFASRAPAGLWFRERRRVIAFLWLSLAIGPGLLVNVGLKEHAGRARPHEVTEFGGTREFTPAFALSDQCAHNCSFVSGEAAGATWVAAGFFVARSRRRRKAWLFGGLAFGAVVGVARVVSGHHFLSDVVLAMALSYVVMAVCAVALLRGRRCNV